MLILNKVALPLQPALMHRPQRGARAGRTGRAGQLLAVGGQLVYCSVGDMLVSVYFVVLYDGSGQREVP